MKSSLFKVISVLTIVCAVFAGCKDRNEPTDPTNSGSSTTVIPTDTTITTTDTIRIIWNGNSVNVEGSNANVSVSNDGGCVTINSTLKDISYILSGNGVGQLNIYSTNRLQLQLYDLTLSCADGPAINNQCKKSCFVVLNGTNSLTDGSTYTTSTEDRKAAFFSEGQMIFSGNGILNVKGNYKHAIASDDYIHFTHSTGTVSVNATSDGIHANDGIYFDGGIFQINAGEEGIQCDTSVIVFNAGEITVAKAGDKGIAAYDTILINGGTIHVTSEYKCIKTKGNMVINGGDIQVVCTGEASNNGGQGGGPFGGNNSSENSSPEGIEAKGTITINGGYIYSQSADDAINAGGDFTINGGCICAYSTGNDGIDANGNCYIKGGLIYAIGANSPEVAIDANTEERKKLYIQGGTIIAIGNLESGASITGGTCKSASSWTEKSWYALYNGSTLVAAFQTPAQSSSNRGGGGPGGGSSSQKLVVYTSSTPALKSGVTANGTSIFNGMAYYPATVNGGSTVSLTTYSNNGR